MHHYDEIVQLERAFRRLMVAWMKLVLKPAPEQPQQWPAMQQVGAIAQFVARNAKYARPTQDPIYRKQSFESSIKC